jgi:hypothetical protein
MLRRIGFSMLFLVLATVALAAAQTTGASASGSVAALWHMDETSGTTMVDASGHGNDGTLHDVTLGVGGDPRFSGTAYGFNGTSSYVVVPSSASLNPGSATLQIAFSMKTTTVPAAGDYDLIRKGSSPSQEYKVELQPNGQVSCAFKGSAHYSVIQAGPDLHDGAWHRVICAKRPSTIAVTIDGATSKKSVKIGSISNTSRVVIGAHPNSDYYKGTLDEVSITVG